MKNILGLDLGTNSIGWSVVGAEQREDAPDELKGVVGAGVRIIPMDAKQLGDFESGNSVSATRERTAARGIRRLYQRRALRRERLLRVLRVMDFLPVHYAQALTRYGKFTWEVRLPWTKDEAGKPLFLFQDTYDEMLRDFQRHQPEWVKDGARVPYDWTIYYLRKKALTQALTPYELAWVLLQFNQKRGYNLTRSQKDEFKEDAKPNEKVEILTLRVESIEQGKKAKNGGFFWKMQLSNGMTCTRIAEKKPEWEGMERDFLVTTKLDKDGNPMKDKQPEVGVPKPDNWAFLKKRTECSINDSRKTVGEYIYDALLRDPKQKIIGNYVRTIDRRFYEGELMTILKKQQELLPQLKDTELYDCCIRELYPSNEAYRLSIARRDFAYLLGQDILLYQRPLKSKKSLIDECPYESHTYINNKETGEKKRVGVKCIARSHPLFQEFRLWQFISNLRLFQRECRDGNGTVRLDVDVTGDVLTAEKREEIFETLSGLKEVNQKTFLEKCLGWKATRVKKGEAPRPLPYYWNYSQDDTKNYPCCPTRAAILGALGKAGIDAAFLTSERLEHLWHILYSIDDTAQLRRTLKRYAERENLPVDAFVKELLKLPAFERDYGSYSAKAIGRLLPLMRMGSHWRWEDIDAATRQRIDHIIDGEVDETVPLKVREKMQALTCHEHFRGLPLWQACYVVYGRHSEGSETSKWNSPEDIDTFLHHFRQHSMRNPIVEQVVTETLRTVRDIWKEYGHIDEIHIEMGRDLKQTAEQRKRTADRNRENETRNQRIRVLLSEFVNPKSGIEGVRPYSPMQQDILQLYEEGALTGLEESDKDYEFVRKMRTTAQPTPSDVERYRLWLDQKYISPYTGEPIPLARLFTSDYEIEHIIPRSRFFDDSIQNKVICESAVNKLKDNQLGMEFIHGHAGETVTVAGGKTVRVLSEEEYTKHVTDNYAHLSGKRKRLLMDDIPDEFIERQLNDSRYIARYVTSLLSNIVRRDHDDEGTNSVNVIPTNGSITERLKTDWGVKNVWNRIILPRFQRMNRIQNTNLYTKANTQGHEIPSMPLEQREGFTFKRIDHRHHAMDAIVIACTGRRHVQLLNNEAAKSGNKELRHQLSHLLRRYEEVTLNNGSKRQVPKEFLMPWSSFPVDVERSLRNIVVSFKQNLRVINKTVNRYTRFADGKKIVDRQLKGDCLAIRKPMHEDTYYGKVNLQRIDKEPLKKALEHIDKIQHTDLRRELKRLKASGLTHKEIPSYFKDRDVWADVNLNAIDVMYLASEKGEHYYATRKPLDDSFNKKTIESITDKGIQKILLAHLARCNDDPKEAFSADGIEEMNRNIRELNNGHDHQPIKKVRYYVRGELRFPVGQTGNKVSKFVKTAKGTNLFFAVYEHEKLNKTTGKMERERTFDSIPLITVINRLKSGQPPVPADRQGARLLFSLSPGDLVYLPTLQEQKHGIDVAALCKERIYKMVSCTSSVCHFVPYAVASIILDKVEFEAMNKMQVALTGETIKQTCLPIKVDRLGRIIEINGQKI